MARPVPVRRPVLAAPSDPIGAQPVNGASYPQILRGPTYLWWRSVLGAVFGISVFMVLLLIVPQVIITLGYAATSSGLSRVDYFAQAFAFERPIGLLAANLAITGLIGVAVVMMGAVHELNPRWLLSVQARLRGRYLLIAFAVALVLPGVYVLSILTAPPTISLQKDFWAFVAVIVLTSPLQALAEEVFFRGYLLQALGSLSVRPWFGILASSLLFALFHGAQNWPLFIDRLAFGLLAAGLVYLTGGLEAGIAAHVMNNIFAFGIAGATTSIAALKATQSLTWVQAGFDVGGFALFAALAYLAARLVRLRNRVALTTGASTASV